MSLPASIRSYPDCQQLFELAASDPKGARACMGTYEAAIGMRTRLHKFRVLDREANADIYPRGDPKHAVSLYDEYVVQIVQDEDAKFWTYVTPRSSRVLAMEGLSEVGDLIDIDGDEVKLLEGPQS